MTFIKTKQLAAFLLSGLLLLFVVLSMAYTIQELEHDCTPEQCPICICVHELTRTYKQIASGLLTFSSFSLLTTFLRVVILLCLPLFVCTTLITQKVRMDN